MLEELCGRPKEHAKVDGVSARQVFEHWSLVEHEQRADEGYRSPRSPATLMEQPDPAEVWLLCHSSADSCRFCDSLPSGA